MRRESVIGLGLAIALAGAAAAQTAPEAPPAEAPPVSAFIAVPQTGDEAAASRPGFAKVVPGTPPGLKTIAAPSRPIATPEMVGPGVTAKSVVPGDIASKVIPPQNFYAAKPTIVPKTSPDFADPKIKPEISLNIAEPTIKPQTSVEGGGISIRNPYYTGPDTSAAGGVAVAAPDAGAAGLQTRDGEPHGVRSSGPVVTDQPILSAPEGPMARVRLPTAADADKPWTLGERLPRGVPYVGLSWHTYSLPKPPPGHVYVRVGQDVLMITSRDRIVVAVVPTGAPEG